jgi:hypothetical protein
VTWLLCGTSGSHLETLSLRLTLSWSTSRSRSVDMYEIATAPLRKCMSVVAGTPGIDSPHACVSKFLPSTVTRTMAERKCWSVMTDRTTAFTAATCAGLAGAAAAEDVDDA